MGLPVFKLGIQDYFGPICAFCWFLGGLWLIAISVIRPFYISGDDLRPVRPFYFGKKKKAKKEKTKGSTKAKSKSAKKDDKAKSTKSKKSKKKTEDSKEGSFKEVSAADEAGGGKTEEEAKPV
ncbi:unnamed protein product [Bursaphelenchus okinawaensis]|uniref:Uncharacterized protein n=1 Tax=Bursaphelenchus okinawaensis TaxID=465554 RepID=A0A811KT57_9BILA|nr:unnamed protein product [Bursaphelenchus okinawaensis]CAG9111175.1 unnamed protein product [Bursaphelenchus okinawaensis]